MAGVKFLLLICLLSIFSLELCVGVRNRDPALSRKKQEQHHRVDKNRLSDKSQSSIVAANPLKRKNGLTVDHSAEHELERAVNEAKYERKKLNKQIYSSGNERFDNLIHFPYGLVEREKYIERHKAQKTALETAKTQKKASLVLRKQHPSVSQALNEASHHNRQIHLDYRKNFSNAQSRKKFDESLSETHYHKDLEAEKHENHQIKQVLEPVWGVAEKHKDYFRQRLGGLATNTHSHHSVSQASPKSASKNHAEMHEKWHKLLPEFSMLFDPHPSEMPPPSHPLISPRY